jgi:hypothetical protein
MENFFTEHIALSVTIIMGLFGILASHRLLIYREQKKRFDDAADELRKSFIPTIADICDDFSTDALVDYDDLGRAVGKGIKSQHRTMINFRYFLKGKRLERYIEACDTYYDNYKTLSNFHAGGNDPSAEEILKCISNVLKFTHYGYSLSSIYFWKRTNIAPRISDEEIRSLIDSIIKEKT